MAERKFHYEKADPESVLGAVSITLDQVDIRTRRELYAMGLDPADSDAYIFYLKKRGAVYHGAPRKDGRRMSVKEFAAVLTERYHDCERVCVILGKGRYTALFPHGKGYRPMEKWPSGNVQGYWVYRPEPSEQLMSGTVLNRDLTVTSPVYGDGKIDRILLDGSSTILTIHFQNGWIKQMRSEWLDTTAAENQTDGQTPPKE